MLLDIREAKEGMVLRTFVTDAIGHVLLPAGSILIARHIEKLQRWGIANIDVSPVSAEGTLDAILEGPDATATQRLRLELIELLNQRFASTQSDPLMKDLRRITEEHLLHNHAFWDLIQLPEKPS